MRRFLIWIFIAFTTIASGQNPVLQSGPMLGPVTLRDCSIWFQTKAEATVQIAYHMVDGNKEEATECRDKCLQGIGWRMELSEL